MIADKTYPFTLPALPYAYDALAPYITQETMHFHHDKHFQTYIDNLNKALEPFPQYHCRTLEQLLRQLDSLPAELQTPIRNNGGGAYNHDLYFDLLSPIPQSIPAEITTAFGDAKNFTAQMKAAGLAQFGSGFAWLTANSSGSLCIRAMNNQDNPLSYGEYPLLTMDVWEHAYYLQYQNRRADYIDNWFKIINWVEVVRRMAL